MIILFTCNFLIWYIFSGYNTIFLLTCGVLSSISIVYFLKKVKIFNNFKVSVLHFICYIFYVVLEIFKSSYDVVKIILFNDNIKSILVELDVEKNTDIQNLIYTNSITITPGTIFVDFDNNKIIVHCLNKNFANSLQDNVMINKIRKLV